MSYRITLNKRQLLLLRQALRIAREDGSIDAFGSDEEIDDLDSLLVETQELVEGK